MVLMGNSRYSKILGIGDISFLTNLGYHLTLKYVRHIADLASIWRLELHLIAKDSRVTL